MTANEHSFTIRMPAAGEAANLITLNIPAPLAVLMTVRVLSYTGAETTPDLSSLDLMKLLWSGQMTQAQMNDFKAGKEITVALDGGMTVTIQQSMINPATLTQAQRDALFGTLHAATIAQRRLVSVEVPAGEQAPNLDQVALTEEERNQLMQGQAVTKTVDGVEVTLRLFSPAAAKVVTVVSWVQPDGTTGTGVPAGLDGLALTDAQWADPTPPADGQISVSLADGSAVTLKLQNTLPQDQQDRLAAGDTGRVFVLVENDGAADGRIEERALSNVRVEETLAQVTGNYFGGATGIQMTQHTETDGTIIRDYTFVVDPADRTKDMTVHVTLGGFDEAYRREYQGTMRLATAMDFGVVVRAVVTGIPLGLKTLTLTAAQWAELNDSADHRIEVEVDGVTITLERVDLSTLTEQQRKDLRDGRLIRTGTAVLANVGLSTGEFFVTDSKGNAVLKVVEHADGTITVLKRDAEGEWADATGTFEQKDLKAIREAKGKVGAGRTAAVTVNQPLVEERILDEADLDRDGDRTEPVRLARNVSITVDGASLPLVNGSRTMTDVIQLTGLLDQGGAPFSPVNGFEGVLKHDPDLPVLGGVVGANAAVLIGQGVTAATAPRAPPATTQTETPSSSPTPQIAPQTLSNEEIAGQLDQQFRDRQNLAQRVLGRLKDLLLGLMRGLQGAAAGALGVLTESRVLEIVSRMAAAFGAFLINCGAAALAALAEARQAVLPDQLELAAAQLLVTQLMDQGLD